MAVGDTIVVTFHCVTINTTEPTKTSDAAAFGPVSIEISSHSFESKPHLNKAKTDENSDINTYGSYRSGDSLGRICGSTTVLATGASTGCKSVEKELRYIKKLVAKQARPKG